MSESLFIFTFSPVQPFIAEARRADDMYTASQILGAISLHGCVSIKDKGGNLIFPSQISGDIPNRIVAVIPSDQVKVIAQAAEQALLTRWGAIAKLAHDELCKYPPKPDQCWKEIWDRQIQSLWEIYWAAVPLQADFKASMKLAQAALDSAKRTRQFNASEESGPKDTLSGKRSALHTAGTSPAEYWKQLASHIRNSRLLARAVSGWMPWAR